MLEPLAAENPSVTLIASSHFLDGGLDGLIVSAWMSDPINPHEVLRVVGEARSRF
jgi:hypothetical protein